MWANVMRFLTRGMKIREILIYVEIPDLGFDSRISV